MNKITFYFIFFWVISISAQSSWKKLDSKSPTNNKKLILRKSNPKNFNLYNLDTESFKEKIKTLKTISIPNSKGESTDFKISESSSFSRKVAKSYGEINSYSITGINDKGLTGKISIGYDGVHVMILSNNASSFYIDPYTEDKSTYITYSKNELETNKELKCLVDDSKNVEESLSAKTISSKTSGDGLIRTYRLALACTGEYSEFHYIRNGLSSNDSETVKKASVLSAMNTTMTRINGIFEKEIGVKMEIVLNNNGENELIFLDANSDNLSNDDALELIEESQTTCDNVIGSGNYDIGHTFSTGAGGLAFIGSVCRDNVKGQGITGGSFPIGDAFDIDFVAHEFGHQFGANHSFNSVCIPGNRWNPTAVEPGSGSTIMSYAGICNFNIDNIQNNVDDYFHAINIEQMYNVIQNTSCYTTNNIGNTTPIVNAGEDVSVPVSTPLKLKGEGSDIDNDNVLTYNWDQTDNEIATMPPLSTNIAGPSFRSKLPSTNSNRYLPELSTVIAGSTQNEWEVIPSVAREMNFFLTVRDNVGAFAQDDLTINFIDTEAFTVTSQNTTTIWEVNTNETITWNKSTTDEAPINCENVRIKLSTDGGNTFPITLVESTPNDGSFEVTVPNQITNNARIMVEAIDNIFYNINIIDFTIQSSEPTFLLSDISENTAICGSDNITIEHIINISYINDFSETVNLSVNNLPANASFEFSNSTINESGTVTLTINGLDSNILENYNITGTSNQLKTILTLPFRNIIPDNFSTINNISPINNVIANTSENLIFQWEEKSNNALLFDLEISSDINFINDIILIEDIGNSFYTLEDNLLENTYYWRVKPKNNCAEGEYSDIFNFIISNSNDIDNLSLWPNPVENDLNISFNIRDFNSSVIINIFDLTGKLILTKSFESFNSIRFNKKIEEIDLSNITTGIYLINIQNGNLNRTKKIIIK